MRTICRYSATWVGTSTLPSGWCSIAGSIPGGPAVAAGSSVVDVMSLLLSFARGRRSILVGDEQLFGREQRQQRAAAGRDHDLLLDSRRRLTVGGGAIGLEREDHALAQLDRVFERIEAGDDRPLVQPEPETVAELQPERGHLALETEVLRFRPQSGDLIGGGPRPHQVDRRIDPFPSSRICVALRRRRATNGERAVVARAVPVEGLDDVEIRLVARAYEPICEIVGMGVAALAG